MAIHTQTLPHSGAPVSVQVGTDASTAPRYYYVYDARGARRHTARLDSDALTYWR